MESFCRGLIASGLGDVAAGNVAERTNVLGQSVLTNVTFKVRLICVRPYTPGAVKENGDVVAALNSGIAMSPVYDHW